VTTTPVPVDCNAVPQLVAGIMTGRQETPPNTSPGLGEAKVYIDQASGTIAVCWHVVDLVAPISAAHIHQAPFGGGLDRLALHHSESAR